ANLTISRSCPKTVRDAVRDAAKLSRNMEDPPRMRSRIAAALILTVVGLLPFAGCKSYQARSHVNKAEDAFEKRDLKTAQQELKTAISIDPDSLDAHKSLAHIDEY